MFMTLRQSNSHHRVGHLIVEDKESISILQQSQANFILFLHEYCVMLMNSSFLVKL